MLIEGAIFLTQMRQGKAAIANAPKAAADILASAGPPQ
jgi:hypothetical protein